MSIRTRILGTLLCMAALVALVGVLAVDHQRHVGMLAAIRGSREVATAISLVYAADKDPNHAITRAVVTRLHTILGHDIEVIDRNRKIIADIEPDEIGSQAAGLSAPLDKSLRDGRARTITEVSADYPQGIRQVAVPAKSASGEVIGAAIIEYSGHYDEIMEMTRTTRHQVIYAAGASVVIAILLALYVGHVISTPLRRLTAAATAFASDNDGVVLPAPRKDEIGKLTQAFAVMMERRTQAKRELMMARDELESRVNIRTNELAAANDRLKIEAANHRASEEAARESEEEVRQMAADLASERARFEEILNTVPALVFENWPTENKRFASNYVRTMIGCTPEEWYDGYANFVHPDDRERVLRNAAELLKDGHHGELRDEVRWITKDKRVVWGETHVRVVHNPEHGTKGVRGFTVNITERKLAEEKLEQMNRQLVDASRHAGMAEVATNVLHNVGNVLNSVNISAGMAREHIRESSVRHLAKAASLIEKNAANLAEYFATDPVGKKLPSFLSQLALQLEAEHKTVLHELEQLGKNVEHIKDIVSVQQSYASAAGVSQTTDLVDLVEDSLRMNAGALMRHDVEVVREYECKPTIQVDKHKVMQILVNLVRNAKYACDDSGREDKKLTIRVARKDEAVRISVIDNGVGIPAENLTKVFSHGFTTRKLGHGFGLHSGALAARELGGALVAHSEGPGRGAEFTLELPLQTPHA